jgi:hypothetical protein
VPGDAGLDQLLAEDLEPGRRAGLVHTHEARILDHIGSQDRGELALDRLPVCDVTVAWRPPVNRAEAGDPTWPGRPSSAFTRQGCCSLRILLASAGLFASARGVRRAGNIRRNQDLGMRTDRVAPAVHARQTVHRPASEQLRPVIRVTAPAPPSCAGFGGMPIPYSGLQLALDPIEEAPVGADRKNSSWTSAALRVF